MNRVPVFVFGALFAVIGILAASSVYVAVKNDTTIKTARIGAAPPTRNR